MKKILIGLVVTTGVSIAAVAGSAAVDAITQTPERPAWVGVDGKINYKLMPDSVTVPYTCWNGKNITLAGKAVKQKMTQQPEPGTPEYQLGVSKSKKLSAIPGVVTKDKQGGEVLTIDDTNPAVQQVMKKYERIETPQCK